MKKININLLGKLIKKFKLSQGEGDSSMQLMEMVIPVFNVDSILGDTKSQATTGTTTERTDTYTVPSGKYWIVNIMRWYQSASAQANMRTIIDGNNHDFDVTVGTSKLLTNLNLKLTAGESLEIYFVAGSSRALTSGIVYLEFDES